MIERRVTTATQKVVYLIVVGLGEPAGALV